jgi:tRNA dimethylallyltransferase
MKPLLAIAGATACGKTSASIFLAKHLRQQGLYPQIINFDSLCFYREISIGTAKPGPKERGDIPHHLFDTNSIGQALNASDYCKLALPLLEDIWSQKNHIPLLVGGSGFYLRALVKGMADSRPADQNLRDELNQLFEREGITPFRQILKEHDPASFERIHPNDHYRTIRAVEHWKMNGTAFSQQLEAIQNPYDFSQLRDESWKLSTMILDIPKEEHWPLICQRTEKMLKAGLVREVEDLLEKGFSGNEKPLESIGYKETLAYLRRELNDSEFQERINISTRQLAKAQRTFFKKITPSDIYDSRRDNDKMAQKAIQFLETIL